MKTTDIKHIIERLTQGESWSYRDIVHHVTDDVTDIPDDDYDLVDDLWEALLKCDDSYTYYDGHDLRLSLLVEDGEG